MKIYLNKLNHKIGELVGALKNADQMMAKMAEPNDIIESLNKKR